MRLKLLCLHDYRPVDVARGENLLGHVTWAVKFQCRRCLKIRHRAGYPSRGNALVALQRYRDLQESGW